MIDSMIRPSMSLFLSLLYALWENDLRVYLFCTSELIMFTSRLLLVVISMVHANFPSCTALGSASRSKTLTPACSIILTFFILTPYLTVPVDRFCRSTVWSLLMCFKSAILFWYITYLPINNRKPSLSKSSTEDEGAVETENLIFILLP